MQNGLGKYKMTRDGDQKKVYCKEMWPNKEKTQKLNVIFPPS